MILNQDILESIILEWFARSPKGYINPPYNVLELKQLESIIREHGFDDIDEAMDRVRQLNEDSPSNKDIDNDGKLDDLGDRVRIESIDFMDDPEKFSEFIYANYVDPGETILNLEQLYEALKQLPKELYTPTVKLIGGSSKRKLAYGTYKIGKYEELLLKLIMKHIRLKVGHPLQLWFSILHEGRIKAALSNDSDGINSDIIKQDGIGISLKKFGAQKVVNFGQLPKELTQQVQSLIAIFTVLMDRNIDLSRDSINDLFARINDPSTIQDIQQLIAQSKDTKVQSIAKLGGKLEAVLKGAPPAEFVNSFCMNIDQLLAHKLKEVNWWGCVSGDKVILQSSHDIFERIKCKNDKLSRAIITFDDYHLWVDSTVLYKEDEQEQPNEQ